MVLDAGQITTWRTTPTSVGTFVFLHRPATVLAARLNSPVAVYPATQIFIDGITTGAITDVREDMTVLLGSAAGLDDYGRTRIRRDDIVGDVYLNTDILFIQRSSRGTLDGEVNLVDNAYVTVLDLQQVWSIAPFIEENTGTVFKDYDRYLSAAKQQRPCANAGADLLVVLPSIGSTYDYDYGEIASFGTHPDAGSLTYAWVAPDGQTSSTASGTFTFTADTVGYLYLTVTDARGNSSQAKCLIAVVNEAHQDLFWTGFEIVRGSHVHNRQGQSLSIRFTRSIPYGTYPDGTEILIGQRQRFGSTVTTLTDDMIFAGWIGQGSSSGRASGAGFLSNTTFQCLDVAGRASILPAFTLLIEREDTPDGAGEMDGANIDRYVFHIYDEHSNVMRRADFTWSGTGDTYGFQVLGSDGGSLYDQADIRTQAIAHKLTCDHRGRLWMKPDPQLQESGDRTGDVIVPIAENDWESYEYTWVRTPSVHWNWGEAIVASTVNASAEQEITTVFCVAPGSAPGQGLSSQTSGQQIVDAATPQVTLNNREGQRYKNRLNPVMRAISVALSRHGDAGIDPATMKWIQFEITANTAGERGRTVVNTTRFLPLEVRYDYDHRAGTRRTRLVIEKEDFGFPAETYVPPDDPGFEIPVLPPYRPPVITNPPTTTYDPLWLTGANDILIVAQGASGTDMVLNRVIGYKLSSRVGTGESISLGGETLIDYVPSAFGNHPEYLLTSAKIYSMTGYATTGVVAARKTHGLSVITGHIQTERAASGWFMAVMATTGGVYVSYTTDGLNWSTPALVGHASYPGYGMNHGLPQSPGLWMSSITPGFARLGAFDGSNYRIYETTDYGATWTANQTLAPLSGVQSPAMVIVSPYGDDTNFYVGRANHGSGVFPLSLYYWNGTTFVGFASISGNGPHGTRSLAIPSDDALKLLMAASANDNGGNYRSNWIYTSDQFATASINGLSATGSLYSFAATASNGLDAFYNAASSLLWTPDWFATTPVDVDDGVTMGRIINIRGL